MSKVLWKEIAGWPGYRVGTNGTVQTCRRFCGGGYGGVPTWSVGGKWKTLKPDIDDRGKFMLSGYRSQLYDSYADEFGWNRTEFELPNNAAGGKSKRKMVECVWTNFEIEGTSK